MLEITEQGTHLSCVITSEDDAWELLQRVADDEFDDRLVLPEFQGWPDLKIKFWRDESQQTLTAPMMEGLLEVQAALYRAFLLVEEETSNLKHLSEYHREKFEIPFKIGAGSTEVDPKWTDIAQQFVTSVCGKMSGRQATVVILGGILSFSGYSSWAAYLDHKAEIAKSESSSKQIEQILESHQQADATDLKRFELLRDILTEAKGGQEILESSDEAKEGILKSAKRVDNTTIGHFEIQPEAAKRMARIPRAESSARNESGIYEILRNDTTLKDGFRVRLKNSDSGEEFFATLSDRLVAPDQRDLIAKAEWAKSPISATVAVTRRRGLVVNARIITASDYEAS